jgi:ABC-type nitrate/sulfonate/bicarbonate transport system substrate-binding protein
MKVDASYMDSSTHMLIARPEYKAVKDLKGKTLGVNSFGATADVARMMVGHSGVDPDRDMKMIALGPDRARFAVSSTGLSFPHRRIPKTGA